MEPEPLKLKALWLRDYDLAKMQENIREKENPDDMVFQAKNIQSAVEWLINIMNKESEPSSVAYSDRKNVDLEIVITNIKEAFEDVINSPKNKN